LNILQVCPVPFGTPEGGVAEYVNNVSKFLARKHVVTVYGTNPKQSFPQAEYIDGVNVERFKHYSPGGAYQFSIELPLRLRKSKFDVVHGHGYHSFPLHFCTLAKCTKFIASAHFHGHGHTPFRDSLLKLLSPLGKRTLIKADKIVAVSEYERSLLEKSFKLDSSKIAVIPNGLNLSEFSNIERSKRDFRSILYVGALYCYKGPQYLIEVLPKLDNDIILEIIGKGPLREVLEMRAKELKISSRVKFYQDLPRDELLQKYVDADLFVMLSRYEAYSIVVAEALASGKRCILTRTSALTEWIDEEDCFGIDFPVDIGELARLVKRVLDFGQNNSKGKKWFGKKILEWKDIASRLESVYLG
jgi:glycosyltransferase involved in cell wall biosynthesis